MIALLDCSVSAYGQLPVLGHLHHGRGQISIESAIHELYYFLPDSLIDLLGAKWELTECRLNTSEEHLIIMIEVRERRVFSYVSLQSKARGNDH